jgi:hypothetical protein
MIEWVSGVAFFGLGICAAGIWLSGIRIQFPATKSGNALDPDEMVSQQSEILRIWELALIFTQLPANPPCGCIAPL